MNATRYVTVFVSEKAPLLRSKHVAGCPHLLLRRYVRDSGQRLLSTATLASLLFSPTRTTLMSLKDELALWSAARDAFNVDDYTLSLELFGVRGPIQS